MNIPQMHDREMTAEEGERLARSLENLAERVRASTPRECTIDRSWTAVDQDPWSRRVELAQGSEIISVEIKW